MSSIENKNKQDDFLNRALQDFSSMEDNFIKFDATKETEKFSSLFESESKKKLKKPLGDEKKIEKTQQDICQKYEEKIAQLKKQYEQDINNLEQRINGYEAIEHNLQKGLKDMYLELASKMSAVLAAYLGQKIKQQAVIEFAKKLQKMLSDLAQPLNVSGNQELIDIFKNIVGSDNSHYSYELTSSKEISFKLNDKVLATNIAQMLEQLDKQQQ